MNRYFFYVAGWLAVVSTATADTVRLTNGHRMEGVVAVASDAGVTIRFSYGEMSLPASMVAGVEKSESALERYLAESAVLEADREATAAGWHALALSARADGLEDGYRRALLRAAELDPHWDGLAAALQALDYVLDPTRGRWVPYEQSAPALELAAKREASRRAAALEAQRRSSDARRERLVESLELTLLAQAVEALTERRRQPAPQPGIPLWGPYPAGPVVVRGVGHAPARGWVPTEDDLAAQEELIRRQPGSLLPLAPLRRPVPRNHRGTARRAGRD